jgi:hypothetical protein
MEEITTIDPAPKKRRVRRGRRGKGQQKPAPVSAPAPAPPPKIAEPVKAPTPIVKEKPISEWGPPDFEKTAMKVVFKFIKSLNRSDTIKFTPAIVKVGPVKSIKITPEAKEPLSSREKMDDLTFAAYFDKQGVTIYDKARNLRLSLTWAFWKEATASQAPLKPAPSK